MLGELLLCLSLMSQAAFAQTAETFSGIDWNEFSYTADGTTLKGARYVCDDDDIDNDNDGLVEVCYLEGLDAIRHQLSGAGYQSTSGAMPVYQGCPLNADNEPRCRGYELVRDLDFAADDSYRSADNKMKWTSGNGWQAIGIFSGIFEGNGHTLSNLRINRVNRETDVAYGLFFNLASRSIVNGIGLLNINIDVNAFRDSFVGGLTGRNHGTISNSYSSGRVINRGRYVGGLVGRNHGTISNSYSSVSVAGSPGIWAGGLTGRNYGTISNSYSTGQVTGSSGVGGLVGGNTRDGTISNSYSTGQVTGGDVGGLSSADGTIVSISNSYWDIIKSGRTTSFGGTGKNTLELQSPTNASGIYSAWTSGWDFGTDTQYPAIQYSPVGNHANYLTCGTSQQPVCASLLGQRVREITIPAQASVHADAVEGEMVVLDASRGNFNYSWVQTGGTPLLLKTTNTAELRFVVPSDLVSKAATLGSLMFRLTVAGSTMQQTTVRVTVLKVNNDKGITAKGTIALKPVTRSANVLVAPPVPSLLPDVDGVVSPATIRYRWQLCLAGKDCSRDSINWANTNGTTRSYSVQGTEARTRNRFRVVVEYRDGQGYAEQLIISTISYSLSSVSSATPFTGMSWSQFVGGAKAVCDDDDIDNDNDGLIELCYLEDIDSIRHVSGEPGYQFAAGALKSTQGCGSGGCKGYELVRDLDFTTDDSYLSAANKLGWTTATGWQPIGELSGIFEGNGHTLSNLRINRNNDVGLFSRLANNGAINGLGLLDVEVRGGNWVGSLVAVNRGTISNSYSSGQVTGSSNVGGLAGWNGRTISNSYSLGPVTGSSSVGGLVGRNEGAVAMISNSYSSGRVSGNADRIGGLIGENRGGAISNSYSVGQVNGIGNNVGGLVGSGDANNITASYWDIIASNLITSAGGTSETTTELQSPTAASGIYRNWRDKDWDFGTAYQYPAIKYTTATEAAYEACGRSQQPLCGALLSGAEWQIRRITIATQTSAQVDALEGQAVVLNAYQGDFNYSWARTGDTSPALQLRATDTAELWFVVSTDLIDRTTTMRALTFELTVSASGNTTKQTVQVIVTKVNNDSEGTTVLGPISRDGNVLTAPSIVSLRDADGVGSTSSTGYRWQLCLIAKDCSDERNWSDTTGTAASYSIVGVEARSRNRFRVVVSYNDGQGYGQEAISNPIIYLISSVSLATTFTGVSWSQFVGGAKAVCDDGDIDNDNDGLIELCYLEDIDAIRYVLNGSAFQFDKDAPKSTQGCGFGGCRGYELVRDLDFVVDDSYLSTSNRPRWTSGNGWLPIGDHINKFSGFFEGNSYTLSNLRINRENSDDVGLFSHLDGSDGSVVNGLGLLDIEVRGGSQYTGSLVGVSRGTISNSYSSGQVSGGSYLGGLVGWNGGTINNSYSSGRVSGIHRVGGLTGQNYGTITHSYSSGRVSGTGNLLGGLVGDNQRTIIGSYSSGRVSGDSQIGGLVGWNDGTITHSYSSGRVNGIGTIGGLVGNNHKTIVGSHSSGVVSGASWVGGLVGLNNSSGRITNSYSTADVNGNNDIGGLVGHSKSGGAVTNSHSRGQVTGSFQVGGLVGWNGGTITHSYSRAPVRGWTAVGGLVGRSEKNARIINSYSRGSVVSGSGRWVGGLIGYNNSGRITNSYSTVDVSGGRSVGTLVGRSWRGTIISSYSSGSASGSGDFVGGLVGQKNLPVSTTNSSQQSHQELRAPTSASGIYSTWNEDNWYFGTSDEYPALKYTVGVDANNPACGSTSTQPSCGSLLPGQGRVLVAISTETSIRAEAEESETIVLRTKQGNSISDATQIDGTLLAMATTINPGERRIFLPSNLVAGKALRTTLAFTLTIDTGTSTQQTVVSVAVLKVNNGDGNIVLGTVSQNGNNLTVPLLDSLPDPDGAGSTSTIRYQWQTCLVGENCSGEEGWSDTSGIARLYSVAGAEARRNNRFRVVVHYTDGQGYTEELVSEPIVYSVRSESVVPVFTGTDWSQFPGGATAACDDGDIDNDNDGLVEVCHLEDLDAIRYVLDGSGYQFGRDVSKSIKGCGSDGCNGYELVRDLDFNDNDSYLSAANKVRWTMGGGWLPIGEEGNGFKSTFNGNGYTLSNLVVNRETSLRVGLFGELSTSGTISGIGLLNVDVRGSRWVGGLVGVNRGTISNSYSRGQLDGNSAVGGLAGWNGGTISNSYSSGQVTGDTRVGGLVGLVNQGTINNSYSSGSASGHNDIGGLVGLSEKGIISNSYSIGQVRGSGDDVGGLVGKKLNGSTATASYWDIKTSKLSTSAGGIGQTTTELQTPTTASGIYSQWSKNDWDFGTDIQYPVLKYTRGTDDNNPTCGTSQQPPCGSLFAEQRIKRIVISTQTYVRAEAVEGEMIVLDATRDGGVNYQWSQGDTSLRLNTANAAILRLLIPSNLVTRDATTEILAFQLTVNDGTTDTQQSVQIVVHKVDNGLMSQVTITGRGKRLIVHPRSLATDPDGAGTIQTYQWQRCLDSITTAVCSIWGEGSTSSVYQLPDAQAIVGNRFRVQLRYIDGQGYRGTVTSSVYTYQKLSVFLRIKLFLEGALR